MSVSLTEIWGAAQIEHPTTQGLRLSRSDTPTKYQELKVDTVGSLSIFPCTADAADNAATIIQGGGSAAIDATRGASIALYGNEHGSTGNLLLNAGGNVASKIVFNVGGDLLALTPAGDLALRATSKFFPDGVSGAGNTYFLESSADVMQYFAGGAMMLTYNATQMGFFGHALASRASAYTITNPSTSRSLNVSTATVGQLAAVVGTILADLQSYGLFQ